MKNKEKLKEELRQVSKKIADFDKRIETTINPKTEARIVEQREPYLKRREELRKALGL